MGIVIILVAAVFVWYFVFHRKKQKESAISAPVGSKADAVVEEALEVVNDFLNVGKVALILSDSSTDFRGCIMFRPKERPPFSGKTRNYGFCIELCNVSDLSIGASKYPKMLTNNPEFAEKYYNFINKYEDCFDPSKKAYVYVTKRNVTLMKDQENQMYAKLKQQIIEHCELAEFKGTLLYTKNVAR